MIGLLALIIVCLAAIRGVDTLVVAAVVGFTLLLRTIGKERD